MCGAIMNRCSENLFAGIIDYAGLFPPARLPMDQAWARFLDHRASSDGWMLARFVCPATRLDELERQLDAVGEGQSPPVLSTLGRGGETLDDFLEGVDQDAAAVRDFVSRNAGLLRADAFEVKLPQAGGVAIAVEKAWRCLTDSGSTPMTPFFEVSLLGDWRPRLPAAAAAVRDTDRGATSPDRVGLKIRCGGLTAEEVPEPMAIAAAIATCRAIGVPLKATQGLHHPFRHHDPKLDTTVHGFINLFVASVLAYAHDLPVTLLTELVAEEDAGTFVFEAENLGWRDHTVSAEEVAVARKNMLTSFGSCSFSEPRDDLKKLELID